MNYEVCEGPRHGGVGQHIPDRFGIKRSDETHLAFLLTESEANIIAFALNKVASNQGGVLAYVRDEGDWDEYGGPTTL